ncbi:MAG: hypothetical protein R3281_18740, partial [Balneolaceae bacterium]|nr:hypothetical protein [Balneolaceae bacterium]
IQRNNMMQVEGELEQEVVALAQDIIEEARATDFDENSINFVPVNLPGDFTESGNLGPEAGETSRTDFDDFDDFNGWSGTITTKHGENAFTLSVEVYYVDENFVKQSAKTTFKKIDVTVSSPYLKDASENTRKYVFDFVRNYYAD